MHNEKPGKTRLVVVAGPSYYTYAPDNGLFEPYVELGDEVKAGQAAGAVHFPDTPWREPTIAHFERDGLVVCKRIPAAPSAATASSTSARITSRSNPSAARRRHGGL